MDKSVRVRTEVRALTLSEGEAPSKVQILKAGVFNHPFYGLMRINEEVFANMVRNWSEDVRKQKLPIDYSHDSEGKAAGWFTRIFTDAMNSELWGEVEWTPAAKKAIADKEFAYFSADFYFQWEDPETGKVYEHVLNGGGLTNRPFIKGMKAVATLSEVPEAEVKEGNRMKTEAQLNAEITQLSETKKGLEGQVKTLSEENASLKSEVATHKAEKAKALKEKEEAEKLAKFEELCRTGKAVAAQKDAYLAGDLVKFAELAGKPNPENKGTGAEGTKVATELSEEEKAICKQMNLSEEDYIKYNK